MTQPKKRNTELYIPMVDERGRFIMRGTKAWDKREAVRLTMGCSCLSFGTIRDSKKTNGASAMLPPEDWKKVFWN